MSNAPVGLKLKLSDIKVVVGTRYADFSSVEGLSWGTVMRREDHPFNKFLIVHMDDTPIEEEILVLQESVIFDFDFEGILNLARVQYERRYFDYKQAILEQHEIAQQDNGFKTKNETKVALEKAYGTSSN